MCWSALANGVLCGAGSRGMGRFPELIEHTGGGLLVRPGQC